MDFAVDDKINSGKDRDIMILLEIPESIASAMRLPPAEQPRRLKVELALSLYAQGILSFGKARGTGRHDKTGIRFPAWQTEHTTPLRTRRSACRKTLFMAVISNTSPILALSAIDHLDLLEGQSIEVLIPKPVQNGNRLWWREEYTPSSRSRRSKQSCLFTHHQAFKQSS